MKELDVVRLNEDYKEISKGEKGTIVLLYDDKNREVEFFDKDGDTIDVVMTPLNKLELIDYSNNWLIKHSLWDMIRWPHKVGPISRVSVKTYSAFF